MSALTAAYVPKAPAQNLKQFSENYASYQRSSKRRYYTADSYNTSVPLDHFNRTAAGQANLFNVKSIYDHQYVNMSNLNNTPIFVYTGNESPIDDFYSMTGFVHTYLAEKFNAAVLYIEHRFYGESVPTTLQGSLDPGSPYRKAFTVEQTMKDFVQIINEHKAKYNI